ncbi:MAG: DUF1294 domain-containing protein [Oscillospiraceae bacterium]|nr:DUF1294 domain-containing protein [Oscillospiraceae bacterium]
MIYEGFFVLMYLGYLLLMSLVVFVMYGIDKRRAKRGEWRISEKALLTLGVIGGAAGALLGMHLFRHKTKHWYFWAINIIALCLQIILPIGLVFMGWWYF